MKEQQDLSWQQAWKRKLQWAQQTDHKITNLAFLTSLFMLAALILYLIPTSGTAYILTSYGGLACVLLSLVFGIRALFIRSRARKQLEHYSQAMDLPLPVEPASPQWEERILRWVFRIFTSLAFLVTLGEIALLWQEQPGIRGHLIILIVTLLTMTCGFLMLLIDKVPEKPQKDKNQ